MNNNALIAILVSLLLLITGILGVASVLLWKERLAKQEIYNILLHTINQPCVEKKVKQPTIMIVPPQIRIIPKRKPQEYRPNIHLEAVRRV